MGACVGLYTEIQKRERERERERERQENTQNSISHFIRIPIDQFSIVTAPSVAACKQRAAQQSQTAQPTSQFATVLFQEASFTI
eukprot:1161193-Pelagomonas_calceolata.AAC.3